MIAANIDYLVLGCSHYPYLIPAIKKILPPHIQIIDSGEAVARQTLAVLKEKAGLHDNSSSTQVFYTNTNPAVLDEILDHNYSINELKF